VLFRSKKTN